MRRDPLQLAGGQRPGRNVRLSPAPRPPRAGRYPAARLLVSPGHPRQRKDYRREPGLFPAPLADMAADELSHSWLWSPAALEALDTSSLPAPPPPARPSRLAAGPRSIECERLERQRRVRATIEFQLGHTRIVHSQASGGGAWAEAEASEERAEAPAFACAVCSVFFRPAWCGGVLLHVEWRAPCSSQKLP